MEAATPRPRGRPSQGAREALVEAARQLFMERDYDRVATKEIIERSGVSRGAFYHHFPGKLDLFRAVYEASERRVIEELAAAAGNAATPFEALLEAARAYLRQAEIDEELRRIGLLQSRAVFGWEGWREAAGALGVGLALAVVSAAMEAGEIASGDPETTALIVLAALIEAAVLIAVADDRAAARERSEAAVLSLLEGMRR